MFGKLSQRGNLGSIMKITKYILQGILVVPFLSCNKHLKYEAGWIIMEVWYKDIDLIDYISLRNFTINFNENSGFVPSMRYQHFEDEDISFLTMFSFYRSENKDYIKVIGSKFFTDTFEIKCIDESCCKIVLKNKEKYVRLIYNGEISTFMKRRECPPAIEIFRNE